VRVPFLTQGIARCIISAQLMVLIP
jgi:hypothetical protein